MSSTTIESLFPRIAKIKGKMLLSALVCDATIFNRAIYPYTFSITQYLAVLTLFHHTLVTFSSIRWPQIVVGRATTCSLWAIFFSWIAATCLFIAAVGRGVCMLDLDDDHVRLFGMVLRPTEVPVQLLVGLFSLTAQLYLLAETCKECYDIRGLMEGAGKATIDEEVLLPRKAHSEKMDL